MIAVTGWGHVVLGEGGTDGECDPRPYLRERKSRKYMGLQDDMAVVAAGRALEAAGLGRDLGERAGLFLSVGHIPFRSEDIDPVLAASVEDGRFSMARFSDGGYQQAHPLLTFRCLPNMPAYHVSACFDVQGPYLVTYPGAAQLYAALEEACIALEAGAVDVALVGGVAHHRNFLVEHHFGRVVPPVEAARLRDAGAMLLLETGGHAAARGARVRARLVEQSAVYAPFDPRERLPEHREQVLGSDIELPWGDALLGAASLPAALSALGASGRTRRIGHRLWGRDGVVARSDWDVGDA